MPAPWEALKDGLAQALREGAEGLVDEELKPALDSFIDEIALEAAREKWEAVHAESDAARELHETNLRHLAGQSRAEIERLKLAASARAEAVLKKAFEVAVGVLARIGPGLFGA